MRKLLIRKTAGIIFLLVILLSQIHLVYAQDESYDSKTKEKLQVIRQMLEKDRTNANRWWMGWLIGYGAATAGQGVIALTSKNERTRQDLALGAATTCLGVIGQLVTPLVPSAGVKQLAGMPETTPEERKQKLFETGNLLKEIARREEAGRSWKMHAVTGVVNIGSGLVVWLGFKRNFWEGVGNFALNTAVTEVQIWTQPTGAMHDYHDYLQRFASLDASGVASGDDLGETRACRRWFIYALPGGVGIRILF